VPANLSLARRDSRRGGRALSKGIQLSDETIETEKGRVLDYGCSWGYIVQRLLHHGYVAVGYEVSRRRARFGQGNRREQRLGGLLQGAGAPPAEFQQPGRCAGESGVGVR